MRGTPDEENIPVAPTIEKKRTKTRWTAGKATYNARGETNRPAPPLPCAMALRRDRPIRERTSSIHRPHESDGSAFQHAHALRIASC
jgi:hypothetical protein